MVRRLDDPDGEDVAKEPDEQGSAVAHEDFGRVKVEHQKARQRAKHGHGHQRRNHVSSGVKPPGECRHGHHAESASQPVDAVHQVDGVHNDDVHEERKGHADDPRQRMDAKQPVEAFDAAVKTQDEEEPHAQMNQEFLAGAHAHDVVFESHEKRRDGKSKHPNPFHGFGPGSLQLSHGQQRPTHHGRENHHPAHGRDRTVMQLPRFARLVHKVLAFGHHDQAGHAKEHHQEREHGREHQQGHGWVGCCGKGSTLFPPAPRDRAWETPSRKRVP